ncbi:MAG: efflux RND transporter permease subunit [Planctomycetota bacterium]
MLRLVIAWALRARVLVAAAVAFALVLFVRELAHVPLDVFPDFAPPQVTVQTEAPGFSAEEVEALVTRPVEGALGGAIGLEALRSRSIQGLSIVTAVFRDDVDPVRARQALAEQLGEVTGHLPAGVAAPRMTPLTSATMDLLKIGLVSAQVTPMELRSLAQWTLRPRLLAVPGVAGVSLFGGEIERIEVQVEPARLAASGLTLAEVVAGVQQATGIVGAGFVEGPNQRIVVETHGEPRAPAELERAFLAERGGRCFLLGDVARVVSAPAPLFGDTLIQGRPGVLLTMLSQHGANTWDVTHAVEEALAELKPLLDQRGIELYPRLHRPATFIEHALGNLRSSLLLGALLVTVVLVLFLYDLRTAALSLLAIPLSLGTAVFVLEQLGGTLNTITLGGLAIALGEVVDDAIIDVENIVRRLRENVRRASPLPALEVVLAASLEVRSAVVHATFVVGLAFLPVLALSGLQGKLFSPLALAYLLAIGASLLVALVVTPALALLVLPARPGPLREYAPVRWLRQGYTALLTRTARVPTTSLAALAVLALGGLLVVPRLGFEFLPEFREGHFVLQVSAAPGTSLVEMRRTGKRLAEALLANPHIATVEQQIGRAELGEDPWGTHRSEFHVELADLEPEVEAGVADEIRAVLGSIPGLRTEVLTFLGDRIGESLSGETAEVVFALHGEELEELEHTAERLASELASVPGAVDVQTSSAPAAPTLAVTLDPEALARAGLAPLPVLEAVRIGLQGERAAELHQGERTLEVVVVLPPGARADAEQIGELPLVSPAGTRLTLADVADLRLAQGRTAIDHEAGRRRASVTCNVVGRDLAAFSAEARARLEAVPRPAGTFLSLGGVGPAERAARRELLLLSGLALAGILVVLHSAFSSPRALALLFLNLPFALLGGALAAWIAHEPLSLGSLIGFVTVFGISVRTSVLLLSHLEHLVRVEGCAWELATIVRGASERFTPILMTTAVTGLGLLPLALQSGAAGREIEGPMAAVILGGLVTSTLLNLLVLPGLCLRFLDPRSA